MNATSAIVTDSITLAPTTPDLFDEAFTAVTQPCPWPKAYGGDMVAQALAAAMRTVRDGKQAHAMHSLFMRPVDIGREVRYEVEALRDGRGYGTRQVRGIQNGKAVYACLVNFAAGAPGGSFQVTMPDVPAPETLPTSQASLAGRSGGTMTPESHAYWSHGRGFDMRHVEGPVYLEVEGGRKPHQALWVRPYDPLRTVAGLTEEQRDLAALAYVCDYTILEPALRVLGLAWADEGLVTASLDHAMWFHRPVPLDGWLLYAQEAVSVENGRGTGAGRFFTPDGVLVASVVQEGMIRAAEAPVSQGASS
ncbi:acyl-CoA thioesterase [Nocardioides acrostichi]|uniref:Thioesterase family protein n=1 Tax=Nocardioides acrostichi TaxID=2784339 RepID=A0A930YCF4_9ACTN|nr:acyl-CoA thioesterase domain-containing protein [Nocardioides acrostichi]MBF4161424.1 thioesterase family protein [Nocardioides acrostichi]